MKWEHWWLLGTLRTTGSYRDHWGLLGIAGSSESTGEALGFTGITGGQWDHWGLLGMLGVTGITGLWRTLRVTGSSGSTGEALGIIGIPGSYWVAAGITGSSVGGEDPYIQPGGHCDPIWQLSHPREHCDPTVGASCPGGTLTPLVTPCHHPCLPLWGGFRRSKNLPEMTSVVLVALGLRFGGPQPPPH